MSLSKPRISDVDIEETNLPLVFSGKTHTMRIAQTCYGDFLVNATHLFMLVADSDEKPAINHFYKISQRCAVLHHKQAKLKVHFEVRKNQRVGVELGLKRG